jgi:hypothetical protein
MSIPLAIEGAKVGVQSEITWPIGGLWNASAYLDLICSKRKLYQSSTIVKTTVSCQHVDQSCGTAALGSSTCILADVQP